MQQLVDTRPQDPAAMAICREQELVGAGELLAASRAASSTVAEAARSRNGDDPYVEIPDVSTPTTLCLVRLHIELPEERDVTTILAVLPDGGSTWITV